MCASVKPPRGAAVAAAVGLAFVVGCGPKLPPTGEVYGKVTYKEKAVTAGTVKFTPAGGGDPVTTELGADGSYRATGVPLGPMKVSIETLHFKNLTPPPKGMEKQMGGSRLHYVPIPDRYEKAATSDLSVDVSEGKKEWNIELK
jgi:hypothetical protein